jgi:hypothetical protein
MSEGQTIGDVIEAAVAQHEAERRAAHEARVNDPHRFDYALSLCCHNVEFDTLDEIASRVRWAHDNGEINGHYVESTWKWDSDAGAWVDAEAEVEARADEQRAAERAARAEKPPERPKPFQVWIHGPLGESEWQDSAETRDEALAKAAALPAHVRPEVKLVGS